MVKKEKDIGGKSIAASRIEKYYSKIVIAFVVLTAVLVLLIIYFSFSKTTIVVHPAVTSQELSLSTTLQELDGVVVLTDVEGSKEYTDITSTESQPGKASGTVTLTNKHNQDQPLVETTRLLSTEGVLFRTQETVTVPAGGTIDVPVAADAEGPEGDIGPSKFEIVALWAGLKEDIYGESSAAMTGGVSSVGIVTETDIANAKKALLMELVERAHAVFEVEVPNYEGIPDNAYLLDAASVVSVQTDEVNVNAGDQVDKVTATQKVTVASPVVNSETLSAYIEENLSSAVPEGASVAGEIAIEDVVIILDSLNDDYTNGDITLSFTIDTTVDAQSSILDGEKLTNKTEAEVSTYLTGFDEVESVELQFSPFWVTRTPALVENITIRVE
ncbi:baseplate J/gp47 family protein [Patescibacteria group bacterium]